MPSCDEVFARVAASIVATFRLDPTTVISPATTSADIEGWDSLSHALLLMDLEQRFGVELPLDRAAAAQNVGELADLVRNTL
jgi:acyl carrier protein